MISNINDQSGMFSKAGKVSLEMYSLLQQKDEIINDKKKYFKPHNGFGHQKIVNIKPPKIFVKKARKSS